MSYIRKTRIERRTALISGLTLPSCGHFVLCDSQGEIACNRQTED